MLSPIRPALLVLLSASVAAAQPPESEPKSPLGEPIGVFNVASVDRVLDDIRWTFAAAEREDVFATVSTVLTTVNDLEGIDKSRPLGAMAFAAPGGNGRPLVVGYVPVTDLDKAMASVRIGPIRPELVDESKGVWKFSNPNGEGSALFVGEQRGYAFLVADAAQLDVVMPRPDRFAAELSESHDIAASMNLDGVPVGLRFLAAAGLQAAAASEQERKPGESDDEFAVRKEVVTRGLTTAQRILNEGRDAVVGFSFDEKRKQIALRLALHARSGTKLAEDLQAFHGRSSSLDRVETPNAPVAVSVSVPYDEQTTALARRLLARARDEAPDDEGARLAFDAVDGLLDSGGVHVVMTTAGGPPRGTSFVVAARMEGAGELVGRLRQAVAGRELPDGATFEPAAFEHRGARFSSFQLPDQQTSDAERLFGPDARLYVGGADDLVWLGNGGPSTVAALKSAMDRVATDSSASSSDSKPVFDLRVAAATLLLLGDERNPEFEAIAQRAFLAGDDGLRFTIGPETDGVAATLSAEEGFVRLLGLGAARAFDGAE